MGETGNKQHIKSDLFHLMHSRQLSIPNIAVTGFIIIIFERNKTRDYIQKTRKMPGCRRIRESLGVLGQKEITVTRQQLWDTSMVYPN